MCSNKIFEVPWTIHRSIGYCDTLDDYNKLMKSPNIRKTHKIIGDESMTIVLRGKCLCCTTQSTTDMEITATDTKLLITVSSCVKSASIELNKKEALSVFKALCE